MKTAFFFSSLLVGVASFGVAPRHARHQTAARAMIEEADMSTDQLEIKKISDKWGEVRMMDKEEAAKLEPEWKEAYDRFHEKYDSDMEKMLNIAERVKTMIEPPKVEKKTQGQRKRDAWAKVQAREAARAAKK